MLVGDAMEFVVLFVFCLSIGLGEGRSVVCSCTTFLLQYDGLWRCGLMVWMSDLLVFNNVMAVGKYWRFISTYLMVGNRSIKRMV